MARFVAEIVTQVFSCDADTEEEAERKYSAYFTNDEPCCTDVCTCDLDEDYVDHSWETM
jgi:hypothetical protein